MLDDSKSWYYEDGTNILWRSAYGYRRKAVRAIGEFSLNVKARLKKALSAAAPGST
jgi:hypothetical protein